MYDNSFFLSNLEAAEPLLRKPSPQIEYKVLMKMNGHPIREFLGTFDIQKDKYRFISEIQHPIVFDGNFKDKSIAKVKWKTFRGENIQWLGKLQKTSKGFTIDSETYQYSFEPSNRVFIKENSTRVLTPLPIKREIQFHQ